MIINHKLKIFSFKCNQDLYGVIINFSISVNKTMTKSYVLIVLSSDLITMFSLRKCAERTSFRELLMEIFFVTVLHSINCGSPYSTIFSF